MTIDEKYLIHKWKTAVMAHYNNKPAELMKDIPLEYELEYAKRLEQAAKELIDKYVGRTAPNIWPELKKNFLREIMKM